MSLLLTDQQKAALDAAPGQPLEVFDSATGARYLIVAAKPESVWDEIPEAERTAWLAAVSESCWRAGWDAPEMAEYDNYEENYRKRFGCDPPTFPPVADAVGPAVPDSSSHQASGTAGPTTDLARASG